MKASDLFVKALENEGVEYIFGIPGEENLDLLESLRTSSIKLILTRHEQAAGFMAATYGRLTGKPGVCLSTLGPGATNLVTAAAYAQLGGMPMVMITGQKPIKKSKQGQFQIIDVVEMMKPITKYARQIVDGSRIPSIVREAFRIAAEERPGATHIELPEDIAAEQVDGAPFAIHRVKRPYPDPIAIETAVEMICQARSPIILVGAGANRNRTCLALTEFVEKSGIPFFNTQMGVGVVDERHPLYVGTAALSANDVVHLALNQADLIINVGHDVVEKPPFFMERNGAKVLHINYFSAKVDDVYFPQHEVIGDIANSLKELGKELVKKLCPDNHWNFEHFLRVKKLGEQHLLSNAQSSSFPVIPSRLVADVRAAMPSSGIVTLDNGLYKLAFARSYRAHEANTLLLDNALATMGAGLPSAIAAKLIDPSRKVVSICGDGGFMMNAQELETAIRLNLDLVIVILNDSAYGMIKWKQSEVKLQDFGLDFKNPDFVAFARAHGAKGQRIKRTKDLLPALKWALAGKGVHVIDVPIDYSVDSKLDLHGLNSALKQLEANQLQEKQPEGEKIVPTDSSMSASSGSNSGEPETVEVRSPHDRSLISTVTLDTADHVEHVLATAKALFDNRDGWLPPYERIAILERLALLMQEQREELIVTALKEGGKPYTDTVVEVDRAIQGVKLGIQAIHQLHGEEVPMALTAASSNRMAFTFLEPIGVVVSLSAFNHPLNLIVHQTIPAIAAGCPVVIKPAIATPASCQAFVKLLHKAGLPENWCQVVHLSNANAEKLATDPRVGYLSFIGSPKVGWYLRSKLAPGTRCALEHGGAAPVIVDKSADLDAIIAPLVKGGYYHAGQVCVSVQRVFVPKDLIDGFAAKFSARVQQLKVGDPADKSTEVGPLIKPSEVVRVGQWVDEAVAAGAKLLCGGKAIGETAFEPTVLLNPPASAKVSTMEIFGPVVCLYSYETLDEAIALSNSLPCAFQAAVFTTNVDTAMYAVKRLNATAVMVNDHTAFRVDWMPFGGRDQSGLGMGGITYSAKEMSREKLMVLKSPLIK
jgi:acetolactate synthase-1/2/3 large subunit